MNITKLRNKFMKIYPNIPPALRKTEIAAVVECQNITFYDIWSNIVEGAVIDQALEQMERLKII